jgi:ATP adenylyltransferase
LTYIKQPASDDRPSLEFLPGADPACFLCQGAVDPTAPERLVIFRDQGTVTVLNRYPYNNGHLLVAPKRHCARLDELSVGEQTGLMQTITRMVALLDEVLEPEGFNVGLNLGSVAGAGLPGHLHWHIVPRWGGDTSFMLSVASVRVIPQALEELQRLLIGRLGQGV